MKMTPRENLLSLYRRQGYEQAPIHMDLCPAQYRIFMQKTGATEYEQFLEYFSFPYRVIPGLRALSRPAAEWGRYYPGGLKNGTWIDDWGIARQPGSDPASHLVQMLHPLEGDITMDDLKKYPFLRLDHGNEVEMRAQADAIKRNGLSAHGRMECTIWETSWYLRNMEDLMVDMMTGDEKAAFLLDTVTDISVERASSFARAGVDVLQLGDDIGMQRTTMMSLDLYREWLKPRLSRVIRAAREINPELLIYYHSCGYVKPFIPDLIEAGVDILNPVQPECMDFGEIYALYGDLLSFNGVLGTQTTMPFGSPEDVRRVVFESLDIAGPKGGLFCCPTHTVEPEVPWENIEAYVQACREYPPQKY